MADVKLNATTRSSHSRELLRNGPDAPHSRAKQGPKACAKTFAERRVPILLLCMKKIPPKERRKLRFTGSRALSSRAAAPKQRMHG
jgi:hypothetical protein